MRGRRRKAREDGYGSDDDYDVDDDDYNGDANGLLQVQDYTLAS